MLLTFTQLCEYLSYLCYDDKNYGLNIGGRKMNGHSFLTHKTY